MLAQKCSPRLVEENRQYADSGGVSKGNSQFDFTPAFLDEDTGQVALSRFHNGRQAPFHLLEGLPDEWIVQRDSNGRVVEAKGTVVSGFVRLGLFFTRQEAMDFIKQLSVEID